MPDYRLQAQDSWVDDKLIRARNVRPSFRLGLWGGLAHSALDTYVLRGKAPWTLQHYRYHEQLRPAADCIPINYPKPNGKVSFDKPSSVYLSNTNHAETQPCHLKLKDAAVPLTVNRAIYAGPKARFCPAGIYEYLEREEGSKRLQISAQNYLHCIVFPGESASSGLPSLPPFQSC